MGTPTKILTPMEARSLIPINKIMASPNSSRISNRKSSPNLALSSTRALSQKMMSPTRLSPSRLSPSRVVSPSTLSTVKKQLTHNTIIPSQVTHRPSFTNRVLLAEPIKTIIAPIVPSSPPASIINYSNYRTIPERVTSPSSRLTVLNNRSSL